MTGWSKEHGAWRMPWPVNPHVHFRNPRTDWDMFSYVVPVSALQYRYVTAMPNLREDRIRTPEQAMVYRQRILDVALPFNSAFDCNVPLYLEPDTDPKVVRAGFELGAWITAKLYPRGGTTGSEEGVDFNLLYQLNAVFALLAELGMLLLVHAEPQHDHDGKPIDVDSREPKSLKIIGDLLKRNPKLKVVMEHITTEAAARWVIMMQKQGCYAVSATVAPQYLIWNQNKLYDGGMNPAWYSIPKLKGEKDRKFLCEFILDYGFLGTDSAPHPIEAKSKPLGCPGGVFNELVALGVYFQTFRDSGRHDWFERFVDFACFRGPRFYGLPVDERDIVLIAEDPWLVPKECVSASGKTHIIPMLAGEMTYYLLRPL